MCQSPESANYIKPPEDLGFVASVIDLQIRAATQLPVTAPLRPPQLHTLNPDNGLEDKARGAVVDPFMLAVVALFYDATDPDPGYPLFDAVRAKLPSQKKK